MMSLLVCLAMAGFWVRSGLVGDIVGNGASRYDVDRQALVQSTWSLGSYGGLVQASWGLTTYCVPEPQSAVADKYYRTGWWHESFPDPTYWAQRSTAGHGFVCDRDADAPAVPLPGSSIRYTIGCPHWFLILICSLLPMVRVRQWLRQRGQGDQGRCAGCGYDLRATPLRCPECGAVPAAPAGNHS